MYAEFDDILGPTAITHFPLGLDRAILNRIAGITIDFYVYQNVNSEALNIIPFPLVHQKGLVRSLVWTETEKRGGTGQGSLTVLFDDRDDSIFYKYLRDFEGPFDVAVSNILELRKSHSSIESIQSELEAFNAEIIQVLNNLSKFEFPESSEEFPESSEQTPESIDQLRKNVRYKFKIIIVGDPNVGKTSTVMAYSDRAFSRSYISTVGVNVTQKFVRYKKSNVQLILWDLAGQIKYQKTRYECYQGSSGALVVYDITSRITFENIQKWYNDLKSNATEPDKLQIILCGNKKDLEDQRQISPEEGMDLADQYNIDFLETSALTGENINEAFKKLIETLIARCSSARKHVLKQV